MLLTGGTTGAIHPATSAAHCWIESFDDDDDDDDVVPTDDDDADVDVDADGCECELLRMVASVTDGFEERVDEEESAIEED